MAMECLISAAENGGIVMMAHIARLRALNHATASLRRLQHCAASAPRPTGSFDDQKHERVLRDFRLIARRLYPLARYFLA